MLFALVGPNSVEDSNMNVLWAQRGGGTHVTHRPHTKCVCKYIEFCRFCTDFPKEKTRKQSINCPMLRGSCHFCPWPGASHRLSSSRHCVKRFRGDPFLCKSPRCSSLPAAVECMAPWGPQSSRAPGNRAARGPFVTSVSMQDSMMTIRTRTAAPESNHAPCPLPPPA